MSHVKGFPELAAKEATVQSDAGGLKGASAPLCRVLRGFEPALAGGDFAGPACFANTLATT
jgi:hypothetical protein